MWTVVAAALKRRLTRRLLAWVAAAAPVGLVCLLVVTLMALVLGQSSTSPPSVLVANNCVGVVPGGLAPLPDGLSAEQVLNAQTIVAVGRQKQVPPYGWVIAIATALQESTLHNLSYGDRDSLGLFQQRGAWGSQNERLNPATAADMFYAGGRGGQPGLLQVPSWQTLPLTVAAQAVQHSAFPGAYAQWESEAQSIVSSPAVLAATCNAGPVSDGSAGGTAVANALEVLGTPYSWGGGGPAGPTLGFGSGSGVVGFDCSSLAQYAWAHAGVTLPRVTDAQAAATTHLAPGAPLKAGDLLFFHDPSDPPGIYHHVGIYDGQGNMVHAPRPGKTVEVIHDVFHDPYYEGQFALATRPGGSGAGIQSAPATGV